MYLQGKEPTFRKSKNKSNPYRILVLVLMIAFFLTIFSKIFSGDMQPLFLATPTPTRTTDSYVIEGETHFES